MNPEEVQSLFAAQLNVFDPISGNPTDADLAQLCEELITNLIPLPYNVEKVIHNLLGLVMYKEYYEQRYCSKLPTSTKPAVYNESIPNNATNVARAKDEAVHKPKIADYQLFAAAERETRVFILAVAENTWVRKFRETTMFYTAVAPLELLDHLQKKYASASML